MNNVNEELLWSRDATKGIFRKKVVSRIAITSRNIVIINYEGPKPAGVHTLPIADIDAIVIRNRHRTNTGQFGFYSVRSGNMRGGGGTYGGKSYEIGDLHFVSHDGMDFIFEKIPDPRGMKDLIMSLRTEIEMEQLR